MEADLTFFIIFFIIATVVITFIRTLGHTFGMRRQTRNTTVTTIIVVGAITVLAGYFFQQQGILLIDYTDDGSVVSSTDSQPLNNQATRTIGYDNVSVVSNISGIDTYDLDLLDDNDLLKVDLE